MSSGHWPAAWSLEPVGQLVQKIAGHVANGSAALFAAKLLKRRGVKKIPGGGGRGRGGEQGLVELLGGERLGQVVVHAGGEAPLAFAGEGVGGDGDDADARHEVFFNLDVADGGGGLVAVELGHVAVHEDGVVAAGGKFIHGLAAVLGPVGARAKTVEHELPELTVEGMILGGEDAEIGNGRDLDGNFAPDGFGVAGQADGAEGFRFFAGDDVDERVEQRLFTNGLEQDAGERRKLLLVVAQHGGGAGQQDARHPVLVGRQQRAEFLTPERQHLVVAQDDGQDGRA